MNVMLISPPAATPFAPPMSVVALKSYLQREGISVVPVDANIDAIHYVVQPDRCRELIKPMLPSLAKGLPDSVQQGLRPLRIVDVDQSVPALDADRARTVLDELERMWTSEGFVLTREGFTTELAIVNDALILASLQLLPEPLTVWGSNGGLVPRQRRPLNPFSHYFRDELVPRIASLSPDLIGVSLGHEDQLFYSVVLIDALRQAGLDVPVAVGGAYFTFLSRLGERDRQSRFPLLDASGRPMRETALLATLLGAVDAATGRLTETDEPKTFGVREEGEAALLQICEHIRDGRSVRDVSNVIYADTVERQMVFNAIAPPLAPEMFPVADLTGLAVGTGGKYLTPIPGAPLMSSRGCYWDKCAFCDHAHTLGPGYRMLPVDVVADSMATYRNEFGIEVVFLADESFSPSMLRRLTDALDARDVFMYYGSMCRIEKAFIPLIERAAKRGLRFLCFGWESACDRLTCRMNKGYTREDSEKLFDECVRNDVRISLFVMFGFPTETPAEAEQTLAYLRDNRDKLLAINPMPWRLTLGSYVKAHPEEFGLIAAPGKEEIGLATDTFMHTEGMDRKQAHEFLDRLQDDPALDRIFASKGVEDFMVILDILKRPRVDRT